MSEDPRGIRSPFDVLVGTEWLDDDPECARVRIGMRDDLAQPFGLMHGGVMLTLIESVCSRATALAVMEQGMIAMGQALTINFLRPVTEGSVEVQARARHRGRTTWVWEAEVHDAEGRLCAVAQSTIAIRPMPGKSDTGS
jgi:uncharacterized protein (TIGR00369 family)